MWRAEASGAATAALIGKCHTSRSCDLSILQEESRIHPNRTAIFFRLEAGRYVADRLAMATLAGWRVRIYTPEM